MLSQVIHAFRGWVGKIHRYTTMKSIAIEYPYVAKPFHGMARISIKNDFSECTGCLKCEQVCPTQAISIKGFEYSSLVRRPTTSKGFPFERELESFVVDYSSCVLCGLCYEVCPTRSLSFGKQIVKAERHFQNLKVDLLQSGARKKP